MLVLIYGNLRGLKEAGSYFAFPTYFYITMMGLTIVVGYVKKFTGSCTSSPNPPPASWSTGTWVTRAPAS